MRKIESERWKFRSSLRFSSTCDAYNDRNLWKYLEPHEMNNIVQALQDTPQQLYETVRIKQEECRQKQKFQRIAIKTEACEDSQRQVKYSQLRLKIEMKTRELQDRRRQLAGTRLQPLVKPSFPFGFYVRDSVDSTSKKKVSYRRHHQPK